jgi:ferredoxin
MIRVTFADAAGHPIKETSAEAGLRLLEVAQAAGMALEGTCEGQMACSTCHVIVDADWFGKLPRASGDEEDMLDLAACATRHSRLSCQITLTDELDGLIVRIPPESRDMQGR